MLNEAVGRSISVEVASEWKPEGTEGVSHADSCEGEHSGRRTQPVQMS